MTKLIVGNCLEELKKLKEHSVDVVVTSPPYNLADSKEPLSTTSIAKPIVYDNFSDALPEDEYQRNQIEVLNELRRVVKPNGHLFYNHKIRYIDKEMVHPLTWVAKSDWSIRQEIVWDSNSLVNPRGWRFTEADERIYWLTSDREKIGTQFATWTSIWRIISRGSKKHPATFPVALPTRCIAAVLQEPGVVLDPYCGLGTTLVAAQALGHKTIGIDLSAQYIQETRKRLAQDLDSARAAQMIAGSRVKKTKRLSFLNND